MGNEHEVVLLLSGGMDSTTLLGKLLADGARVHPVLFNYGQKHVTELESAKAIIKFYQLRHQRVEDAKVITIDLTQIGHSALTDPTWTVPDNMEDQGKTVVPFRNMLMTTLAAAYADTKGITDVYTTPVLEDYPAYRDCRRPFFDALGLTLGLGAVDTTDFIVHTPFIHWKKEEVIKYGLVNNVPYELTHSCYNGTKPACGECPACRERLEAFKVNSAKDPIPYATIPEVLV